MPESITFRGAHIRYYDGRHEEAGAFVRLHVTAEFTVQVMDAMGWEDPGDSVSSANLEGALNSTHMILTPGDKQLKQYELQIDIKDVTQFKVVAIEENEVKRRELRFVIRTLEDCGAGKIEQYVRAIGDHQGALKVSYVKQEDLPLEETKQQTLDTKSPVVDAEFVDDPDEDTGCVSCNNDLPFSDEKRTKHSNGVKCTRNADSGTLASAGQMKRAKTPPAVAGALQQ